MTAPAAPTIRVRSANGIVLRILWQPVLTATDYKVYVGATTNPAGLEADVADDEVGTDGWFQYTFAPDDADAFVAVTALNALAEESAHSNEAHFHLTGPGSGHRPQGDPFSR